MSRKNESERQSCQSPCASGKDLARIVQQLPNNRDTRELAEFFKILGDATRIKILSALYEQELCVCDLAEVLAMKQPAVSQQLRILRGAKIVRYRKEGKNVYYALDDAHVSKVLKDSLDHIRGNCPPS